MFVLTDTTILKITYECLQKCTYLIAFYCWKGGEDAEMHISTLKKGSERGSNLWRSYISRAGHSLRRRAFTYYVSREREGGGLCWRLLKFSCL